LVRNSTVPRLSSIGRQAAGSPLKQSGLASAAIVELRADERLGGFLDQKHGRRDGADCHTRGGAGPACRASG
jgi:hypothetical protein